MRLVRIVQQLFDVLVQEIPPENMAGHILGSAHPSTAFFRTAEAVKGLGHIPLRTRIEECQILSLLDCSDCPDLHLANVKNDRWRTRVIHVNQIRIQLLLVCDFILIPRCDIPLRSEH
jgi:hypothetical protein